MALARSTASEGVVEKVSLDGESLDIEQVIRVARRHAPVFLEPAAVRRMEGSQQMVREIVGGKKVVYGITTGFGKFSNVVISPAQTEQLQKNLVMSHAVGTGRPLETEVVRAVTLLRANTLAKGFSGVRPLVVEYLIQLLNRDIHPVVPEQGSVGASGDLAPLAHIALVLLGLGEAEYRGKRISGAQALELAGLPPLSLQAKEGLALTNGTQLMGGLGCLAVHDAELTAKTASIAAALAVEALDGVITAFDPRVQRLRPHAGQARCAAHLRQLLAGGEIAGRAVQPRVQDAYTLRCTPQVHGATLDAVDYVRGVLEVEINSATDNPLLFPEEGDVISGGNFHGQPLALALDFLGMAVAELGSMAERRTARLLDPAISGLPAFLTKHGGLNSGLMLTQYTAAALVSENKVLASPACVDSIPTSANQEDHVSMGPVSARKARRIIANVQQILAIQLLCAAQAVDLGQKRKMGRGTARAYEVIRAEIPFLDRDRVLYPDLTTALELVQSGRLLREVENAAGELE
ncbi:histidine ammonia-lyase [Desulfotomaculum copahuensis]|uniref:Histidine ammonia-lyase n=1 Tax=Desulfotomaculum copahuensis TaxID=1838280 RepID=A0A1B7LDR5_9FIRM|nr:histidine ammonia-lyase [Desulfotomaculum copahuensis]OAT81233.1 histidine ammonia-lyase [Desulfotomaculum copahuensis]